MIDHLGIMITLIQGYLRSQELSIHKVLFLLKIIKLNYYYEPADSINISA